MLLVLGACSKREPHGSTATAGVAPSSLASASASASPASSAAVASIASAPSAGPTCRALRVVGDAKLGDSVLTSGALIDGEAWVVLGAEASVALKHTQSGRELVVSGPATFRACRRGREQLLLAHGKVTGGASMGSRPGAEVLLATPIGVVRYGDADFTLTLDDEKLGIAVRAGQLELDPATPGKTVKSPLRAQDKLQLPLGKTDVAALMRRCQELAEAAERSARLVTERNASESLGVRARNHVAARKAARSACSIAASATGLVADPAARAGYWAEAERWAAWWESIPRQASQAREN
jgi:hypothetical protein